MQLHEKLAEFEKRGVGLACVVQGTAEEAERFCGRHQLASQCVPDPGRESYRAMGFPRARWRNLLLPSREVLRHRSRAKEAGCGVSLSGTFQKHSDVRQLPGAALVAPGGRIVWLHRSAHVADLPSADELLNVVGSHLLS